MLQFACEATYGCRAFNTNGWLKSCGNTSCGATFEPSDRVDSWVMDGGVPPPPPPPPPVAAVEDEHYPPEEAQESRAAAPPLVSCGSAWAVLGDPAGVGAPINTTVGGGAFGYILVAAFPAGLGARIAGPVAVVERTFARWGFLAYVSSTMGEVARLRKGVGAVAGLTMPSYAALANSSYYSIVYNSAADWLGARIVNDTADGEATFLAAAKYLPPQRDYAVIGAIDPYQKWSVSPDGVIKSADEAIYTPARSPSDLGPGAAVFDPRAHLPLVPPAQANWSFTKSALVGSFLRVVATVGFEPSTGAGFEQIAFAPAAAARSDASTSAFVRLRGTLGAVEAPPFEYQYFNASRATAAGASAPLDVGAFYESLYAEAAMWNATLAGGVTYSLPGREGARQVDTAAASLVTSLSLYVGLQPNYGDGADYWSPQVDRGGSLPFQEIAVVQNLLDVGLIDMAGQRLGWWMDHYITADGSISTGDWEDSCPFSFADGFADYGEMQDMFARTARMQLGYNAANGSAWLAAHLDQGVLLANRTLNMRLATYGNRTAGDARNGLIWGPPEHDTCHEPGWYYHNQVWFVRGMREMGRFFTEVCPTLCPALVPFGEALTSEAGRFNDDLLASLALTVTHLPDGTVFVPPVAAVGYKPYASMIESTVAEYSNFRYWSELLGADILPPDVSVGLQAFREQTQGTVSGITRWSDHLDDMPSSYYLAASLRDDRLERFLLLQLPITGDANGMFRDYLWSYLEGGIDECIPSIMLPAIATRWQLVLERYDEDVVWLAKGAPRRWADPAGGGYGVRGAATRFGRVDVHVANSRAGGGSSESVAAVVAFTPVAVPGTTQAPAFALRLRSFAPGGALNSASVVVAGAASLTRVDAATGTVYVSLVGTPATGVEMAFTVTATVTVPSFVGGAGSV